MYAFLHVGQTGMLCIEPSPVRFIFVAPSMREVGALRRLQKGKTQRPTSVFLSTIVCLTPTVVLNHSPMLPSIWTALVALS